MESEQIKVEPDFYFPVGETYATEEDNAAEDGEGLGEEELLEMHQIDLDDSPANTKLVFKDDDDDGSDREVDSDSRSGCGDNASNKDNLEAKLHKCGVCGKKVATAYHLARHEKIHSGDERPFVCRLCDKAFIKASALKVHLR